MWSPSGHQIWILLFLTPVLRNVPWGENPEKVWEARHLGPSSKGENYKLYGQSCMSMSREHSTGLSVQSVIHPKWTDTLCSLCGCSVTKVVSDSLWPRRQHQVTLLCSLLSPGVRLISCPSSRWHYRTISSSAAPFSSCLQSFPASGSFPMSRLFISSGQIIEASASATALPMNIQGWLPSKLMVLISFLSRGLWRVFSSPTIRKCQFFDTQTSLLSNSHICTWLLGKKKKNT